jgi:3-phosphoshikimate 1-carboxyvinyltransferase
MTPLQISPIGHPLHASVRLPGSKSLTNRALLIAALADGTTRLTNALFSDDSAYFAQALQALGFEIILDPSRAEMTVHGQGGHIPSQETELFIGDAGTAARFLSALLTLGEGEYVIDGDARMRQRPIGDLVKALVELGANIQSTIHDLPTALPLTITARGLSGGRTQIPGDISSQFLSALLMVAPYAGAPVEIEVITELSSKPYVDMTLAIMSDFGVGISRQGYEHFVIDPAHYRPRESHAIEPDASAASYFFAAPAICGGSVQIEDISCRSKQGDVVFLDVLTQMGCAIEESDHGIRVTGPTELLGVDVGMRDIPDTAQTLAAIAPFANSPTHLRGIASARLKETDRIAATCNELGRLGVQVEQHPDGMTIHPCAAIRPACIRTYNDHRMAMAFSLIGLRVQGVSIENPACVSKTFPNYFDVLESLR